MGFIFLGMVFGVAASILYAVAKYRSAKTAPIPQDRSLPPRRVHPGPAVFHISHRPAGYVAVRDLFGSIGPIPLQSGLHMVNPLVRLRMMDIRLNEVTEVADVPSQEA